METDALHPRDNDLEAHDAVTEPSLPALSPDAENPASLGRTMATGDHWEPMPGAWLAPLSGDTAAPDVAPDLLPDAAREAPPMSWPASLDWAPAPALPNQPTRHMRRYGSDADRPLFFALGALAGAALVCGAALLAIVYIASHPGLFTLAAQRPPVAAPAATIRATPTATLAPTPTATVRPPAPNPLPIIVIQPTPTVQPTPQSTTTPTPAPTLSPTAQPTASPTPTAEPGPAVTPSPAPSPTPTPSASPSPTAAPTASGSP